MSQAWSYGRGHRGKPRPHVRGQMNKTEAAYAERLALLQHAGEIRSYRFEAVKLRLANNTFYTPDFLVVTDEQIEFHEVKGFWQDAGRIKIKVAADQYPEFAFVAVQKCRDGWEVEEF